MATPPTFSVGATLTAAQMNAVGLWKTASTTLTGQTTASITNCFSADYENYLFVYNFRTASGSASLQVQLASNGTPNSTAGSYLLGGRYVGYPTVGASDFNAATTFWAASFAVNFTNNGTMTLARPFNAEYTSFTGGFSSYNAAATFGGYHNQAVSYNGLYLSNNSANAMYGTFSVYGMKQ